MADRSYSAVVSARRTGRFHTDGGDVDSWLLAIREEIDPGNERHAAVRTASSQEKNRFIVG
jgi:hypothetical protein